jgi:hypothetical protein
MFAKQHLERRETSLSLQMVESNKLVNGGCSRSTPSAFALLPSSK